MEKQKKEATPKKVQQLVDKMKKETEEKACTKAQHAGKEQAEKEEHNSDRSQKSPSPQKEEEEQLEQGGSDQQESTPF